MQFIDLNRQYERIEGKVRAGLDEVLRHKKFIMGDEVKALEKRLGEYVGMKHVIACANGTDALTIPLRAYGIEKTDAVFVPSFTFFASAESITLAGGTPVFVDCERDTFNISADSLEKTIEAVLADGRLTPRGIVAVDLFGQSADYVRVREIANKYGLFILEDAAQGFGGRIGDAKNCSFGDVAATSFFPAKPLGCYGDGGAIFTNDDDLAAKIRSIHVHGQGSDKYDNVRIGVNSRLDTIQAVVLDGKMDLFDEELVLRDKVAQAYIQRLRDVIEVPTVKEGFHSSWAQFTLKAKDEQARKAIMAALAEKDIPTMIYYPTPIHRSTAYKAVAGDRYELKNTDEISKKVFSIPMHPYLYEEEIEQICAAIIACVERQS